MGRHYIRAELDEGKRLAEDLKVMRFSLDRGTACRAGQYFMLWLPGRGEIPLSPSVCSGRSIEFVVESVGSTSSALLSMGPKDRCFIRGPFGRPFSLDRDGPFLLVGGGTGAAPLLMATKQLRDLTKEVDVLMGARDATRLCYIEEFSGMASVATFATEDGSFGRHGIVIDYLEEMILGGRVRALLTAGPERMMAKAIGISKKLGVYSEASLVRIIKCAGGLCGSCALDPGGQLVCKEGPVLPGSELLESDFGSKMRDATGRRVDAG